jgi:hypothetical protein
MKMNFLIIGLLIVGIVFVISSCNKKTESNKLNKNKTEQEKVDPKNNPYIDMRNMAFGITEKELGIEFEKEKTKIYGVIMDWSIGDETATLISFISGDASLYLSSGGGMIGGQTHENVSNASKEFIKKAENYISKASKTENNPLPNSDEVLFYFLTNKGKFVVKEKMENIESNKSELLNLFEEGNKVISEIRIVTEKQQN